MTKGILGKKVGMTQVFGENGELIPVTVVEAAGNVVLQKKTEEVDGYNAVQIGFDDKREFFDGARSKKYANKAETGHAKASGKAPKRFVREFRNAKIEEYEVGQEISVDIFQAGDKIDVTGTSKGKGFQGVMKRHNFKGGPATHGSRFHRTTGSLGTIAKNDGMHVFKGKKMPGRMGGETVTLQNLEIVKVDAERNVLLVKGNVPGPRKGYLKIAAAFKKGVK
ncbi:MAG TPA: 50S ribosomal protein L3 [Candidatus Salinicoccus stercoripullorum]|uniref:Large ribosomal subunit protein uL3 n=1 Tax=Candidatus Salinicoccus stercoripullorum TaxID=2838756 RepID=A0A9D1QK49_9STAP|nr:50S ribosomal protein L3 [Candidatus Salinicoccus stercoripullorum]